MVGKKKAATSKKPTRQARAPLAQPSPPAQPAAPPSRARESTPEKPAPKPSAADTRLAEAQKVLGGFWGATQSDGSSRAWHACRQQLQSMKLSKEELVKLRRRLPRPAGGTTLLRVQQLEDMLDELAEEAR